MQARLSIDGQHANLTSIGVLDPSRLTREQRVQLTWWAYEAFGAFEFMFHQAQARAIPDEVWQRWSATTAWWLSFPGVRAWWTNKPVPFSASFTEFVEGCLRNNPVDPASTARWQVFVQGTR